MARKSAVQASSTEDLRRQIFESYGFPTEDITVPEWGGVKIRLRGFSVDESLRFSEWAEKAKEAAENGNLNGNAQKTFREGLRLCILNPANNEPLFRNEADIDRLYQKSQRVFSRLTEIIKRLNAETPKEQQKLSEGFLKKDASA